MLVSSTAHPESAGSAAPLDSASCVGSSAAGDGGAFAASALKEPEVAASAAVRESVSLQRQRELAYTFASLIDFHGSPSMAQLALPRLY